MTFETLRPGCTEPDQRVPATDGHTIEAGAVPSKTAGGGNTRIGVVHHQHKHTISIEQQRGICEQAALSSPVQGPSTPDRGVDVPIDLHPHTVVLADQFCTGKPHASPYLQPLFTFCSVHEQVICSPASVALNIAHTIHPKPPSYDSLNEQHEGTGYQSFF
jgi:hypothetical protein